METILFMLSTLKGGMPSVLTAGLPWSGVETYDQDPLNCFHSINNAHTLCSTTQICSGQDISVATSNFTTAPSYQQLYVLVDVSTGAILASNGTGTFTVGQYGGTGMYEVYAVNTNDSGLINAISSNGSWSNVLSIISSVCADYIGPKIFDILPTISNTVTATICFGAQFTSPQGNTYGVGSFDETLTSASGCDSVVTNVISSFNQLINSINVTICPGEQYLSSSGNAY